MEAVPVFDDPSQPFCTAKTNSGGQWVYALNVAKTASYLLEASEDIYQGTPISDYFCVEIKGSRSCNIRHRGKVGAMPRKVSGCSVAGLVAQVDHDRPIALHPRRSASAKGNRRQAWRDSPRNSPVKRRLVTQLHHFNTRQVALRRISSRG